jgi:ArsR family transcriptional regulator
VTFLKALADPTRLKLLKLVLQEELCVCELVDLLQISQPAVSQHLAKLKAAGLVRERRAGMWTYYAADAQRVEQALAALADFLRTDIAHLPAMTAEWERRQVLNRARCIQVES